MRDVDWNVTRVRIMMNVLDLMIITDIPWQSVLAQHRYLTWYFEYID